MNPLAYLAATWLGINAGIATALAAAYRRHNRHLTERGHDFDRHADEALAVAAWDDFGYHDAADLTYHELVTERVLDRANEAWHDCGGVLSETWLHLTTEDR